MEENKPHSARWQHLSQLKASAFFSLKKILSIVEKYNNLSLGLVMPSGGSGGRRSLIRCNFKKRMF
jgi:hypothetical protein